MKRFLITLGCFLIASSNGFAKPFFKNTESLSTGPQPSSQETIIDEDFSGIWKGNCDGDPAQLKIEQSSDKITLTKYLDPEGDDEDSLTEHFYLNKMTTKTDSGGGVYKEHWWATWDQKEKRLILTQIEFRSSLINSIFNNETLIFEKKGNDMTVKVLFLHANTYAETADAEKVFCVMKKS